MIIGVPTETHPGDRRVALIPLSVERLVKKGARVLVETGIGSTIYFTDDDYKKAGATVTNRADILKSSDIVLRVRKPPQKEVSQLKEGSIHISFLDPFTETYLVQELTNKKISTISMGMIPRTTLAQKMDALTSQANLAGYVAVILAVQRMHKILPMMISPAGTIPPARVFIVGAGVAGLQAIATAKRLGARVEAFDTRPIVKEEVESLGAKFVKIKQIETSQDKDGYAKELTPEQIDLQRQAMKKICSHTDILITTAQLFGKKAPVIITKDMIDQMKPGSVIIDMAVESGGNVAMDVCRILCKTVDELKTTDIAQHALDVLAKSNIKEIHIIGRRGPAQAKFTPVEIREFGELTDCDPVVDAKDLEISEVSQAELNDPKNSASRKNYEILQSYSIREDTGKPKKFIIHFQESPAELVGDGKLQKLILEKNELVGEPGKQKCKGTGVKTEMNCDILFRSVGYRGIAIEGVPFHEAWGIFPNNEGRITDGDQVVSGLYTAGWIKRGPSGVVGTNKPDSDETVARLLEDVDKLTPCEVPDTKAVLDLLARKGVRVVSFDDWQKIDASEIERGQRVGKPREKYVSVDEMLGAL